MIKILIKIYENRNIGTQSVKASPMSLIHEFVKAVYFE